VWLDDLDEPLPDREGQLEARMRAKERENASLRRAVHAHAAIEQAKGVVMARRSCGELNAWRTLVTASQHHNVPVREVAEAVLTCIVDPTAPMTDHVRGAVCECLEPGPH
jgi:ATP-dependent helicase YprA (DUF1998 family)